ncbi:hypothetical protein ACWEO2_06960 [Nocardia sp. NPDC004278]
MIGEAADWSGGVQTYLASPKARHKQSVLPLTEVAHEAGFADNSHLNRACHGTPGIAPNVITARFHITLES